MKYNKQQSCMKQQFAGENSETPSAAGSRPLSYSPFGVSPSYLPATAAAGPSLVLAEQVTCCCFSRGGSPRFCCTPWVFSSLHWPVSVRAQAFPTGAQCRCDSVCFQVCWGPSLHFPAVFQHFQTTFQPPISLATGESLFVLMFSWFCPSFGQFFSPCLRPFSVPVAGLFWLVPLEGLSWCWVTSCCTLQGFWFGWFGFVFQRAHSLSGRFLSQVSLLSSIAFGGICVSFAAVFPPSPHRSLASSCAQLFSRFQLLPLDGFHGAGQTRTNQLHVVRSFGFARFFSLSQSVFLTAGGGMFCSEGSLLLTGVMLPQPCSVLPSNRVVSLLSATFRQADGCLHAFPMCGTVPKCSQPAQFPSLVDFHQAHCPWSVELRAL
ncbi:hypothetical protein Salat_1908100 [Sesamum alatum]|uniref:Uncharacterized protein n=1 Tax=Sesamum alatum TaxID=300844 RepID=A0AAE1Y513_9LAMI|nr:hypothetical protein Salat_1908100 [Sesamum alatum]